MHPNSGNGTTGFRTRVVQLWGDGALTLKRKNGTALVLEDIVWIVQHYAEICERARHSGMSFRECIARAANLPTEDSQTTHAARVFEDELVGSIPYGRAQALYRKLSKFFAQVGAGERDKEAQRQHGIAGAKKRWGKEK